MLLPIRIFSFFFILICFFRAGSALANTDGDYFKKDDIEFASNVELIAKPYGMNALREKYKEFEQMTKSFHHGNKPGVSSDISGEEGFVGDEVSLKVFVSTSMNRSLLKSYARAAKKYKAILVFNGLPEGSFRSLSDLVFDITENEEEAFSMQIDDTAFEEYGVSSVPTFVLVKEKSIFDADYNAVSSEGDQKSTYRAYDKVTGNIGIKRALLAFSEKGELSSYASDILERSVKSSHNSEENSADLSNGEIDD